MLRFSLANCLTASLLPFLFTASLAAQSPPHSIADPNLVMAEEDGLVAVEAEHFFSQSETNTRAFYLTTKDSTPNVGKDGDPNHVAGASGGAYLEILPDTRRTHGDKLIRGTNFAPEPGALAVLSYKVHIQNPGRYYVWVRAFSTGSEDNGLHVGIDNTWPASGQRLQWCQGKHDWRWESKQRTAEQHCGEPHKIYLDIEKAGEHVIHFSMREDGFEFDKWLMTTDRDFERPSGIGPKSTAFAGTMPNSFAWVEPPAKTATPTPVADDSNHQPAGKKSDRLVLGAETFALDGTGYYLDKGKWAAINPERRKTAKAGKTFQLPTGNYHVTLRAVGENDGQSSYEVFVDDHSIGQFQCPLSAEMFEEGARYHRQWRSVMITEGAVLSVRATTGSTDGQEFSRARWSALVLQPADEKTRKAAAPLPIATNSAEINEDHEKPKTSPTTPVSKLPLIQPRGEDGDGTITVSGEQKVWHKITLSMNGPFAHEQDNEPNPFLDYRLTVTLRHEDGTSYSIPGYFAADGNASESSADSGNQWRAHFAPDRSGTWNYTVHFVRGKRVAIDLDRAGEKIAGYDGVTGKIGVYESDKHGRDFRAHGRLQYVGKRYLQHAGTKRYFVKAGADAPETLLGYADFDNTIAGKPAKVPLKTWQPHVKDWNPGDPTWKDGKGKGLIGAINYLSGKGCNAFSFLTYNAGGDGDNVWPFIDRNDKLHYDCSKLDQWGIVFDHGTSKGMYLHFKMQETENDDHRRHKAGGNVPECLDGGNLGAQRKLYCRELIARFGHNLALNWNLGEENTQTTDQQQAMINYIAALDAYDHHIVIHTFPGEQSKVYRPLLGDQSKLTGLSLQNSGIQDTHVQTVRWVKESTAAGKPWVVAFDESGTAAHGQCPDIGYEGYDGKDRTGKMTYTPEEVRRQTLWGTLMGGGAGVEYYFGYQYTQNDLICEDWRSRDKSWDDCRIAIEFFGSGEIPIERMHPADDLIGNKENDNSKYCLAAPGEMYLVYLPYGGSTSLDLTGDSTTYVVTALNPRTGKNVAGYTTDPITGGKSVEVGDVDDSKNDWLIVLRKK